MVDPVTGMLIGSAISGLSNFFGARNAAKEQRRAAEAAMAEQRRTREQVLQLLAPYQKVGQIGIDELQRLLPSLLSPIVMDQATLEQTPGYQFNLTQGLKAVQESAAARGLGSSGGALKGAARFVTGLADSTYQNQFNNAVTNSTNAYNRLMGVLGVGQNATSAGTAALTGTANQIADTQKGLGNALGASKVAEYGAIGDTANNLATLYSFGDRLFPASAPSTIGGTNLSQSVKSVGNRLTGGFQYR